jgi:hypothetical protein
MSGRDNRYHGLPYSSTNTSPYNYSLYPDYGQQSPSSAPSHGRGDPGVGGQGAQPYEQPGSVSAYNANAYSSYNLAQAPQHPHGWQTSTNARVAQRAMSPPAAVPRTSARHATPTLTPRTSHQSPLPSSMNPTLSPPARPHAQVRGTLEQSESQWQAAYPPLSTPYTQSQPVDSRQAYTTDLARDNVPSRSRLESSVFSQIDTSGAQPPASYVRPSSRTPLGMPAPAEVSGQNSQGRTTPSGFPSPSQRSPPLPDFAQVSAASLASDYETYRP